MFHTMRVAFSVAVGGWGGARRDRFFERKSGGDAKLTAHTYTSFMYIQKCATLVLFCVASVTNVIKGNINQIQCCFEPHEGGMGPGWYLGAEELGLGLG